MPSPIGHALGGAIVALAALHPRLGRAAGASAPAAWGLGLGKSGLLVVAAAVAPDIDFLFGRHNMETHSLTAAVVAGAAVLAWTRNMRLGVAVTLAWASHVLFDWLGSDTTPPLGVMALWPFSSEYYFSHAFFFEAISRRYWLDNFITHNLWAVVKEVLLLGPILAGLWLLRNRDASRKK